MSFDCDVCGKNPVDQYGLWCSECQQREYDLGMESEGRWFSSARKCMECNNAEGSEPYDKCSEYGMPLYMVKRKKKCKRFKEINYNLELTEVWY